MEIILSKHSGFCFGVKKAVDLTNKTVKDHSDKKIKTLGPIIHNPPFIKKLEEKGVEIVDTFDKEDDTILITRAHGTPMKIMEEARKKKLNVIDITCPFVQKIHDITSEYEKKDYQIIMFGEKTHPEVMAISEDLKCPIIIENETELANRTFEKVLLVSQTTQNEETFHKIAELLKKNCKELIIKNTICKATQLRQKAAQDVAKTVDMMIVIGGKNSGNTRRLYQICKEIVPTILIETKEELYSVDFKNIKKLGVSAGASSPHFIISSVIKYLNRVDDTMKFKLLHEKHKKIVDDKINNFFESHSPDKEEIDFIKELYKHIWKYVVQGGKRLRPVSLAMAYMGITNKKIEDIYKASIAVELYHACTLIHDDIMDEDQERRGFTTIFELMRDYYKNTCKENEYESILYSDKTSRFAITQGMLAGNYLDAISLKPILESKFEDKNILDSTRIMAECATVINTGQMMDTYLELNNEATEKNYFEMVKRKTTMLFVSSIQIGLTLANASSKQYKLMSDYAWNCATTFQLQDDIMDISTSSKKGHELGSDIRQGKRTLLIIKAIERASKDELKVINKTLGNSKATKDEIVEVINIIKGTKSLEYAQQKAQTLITDALKFLDDAKLNKESHEYFKNLASYMMTRDI